MGMYKISLLLTPGKVQISATQDIYIKEGEILIGKIYTWGARIIHKNVKYDLSHPQIPFIHLEDLI